MHGLFADKQPLVVFKKEKTAFYELCMAKQVTRRCNQLMEKLSISFTVI
jgi:hypothetical protein